MLKKLIKTILISASFLALTCHAQEVFLECKLNRWTYSDFSIFEPLLIIRRMQFDQPFLVQLDLKNKTAKATNENYEIYANDSEKYVIKGRKDGFTFDRETGDVYWIIITRGTGEGLPVALGSCEARTNKKKF